MTPDLESYGERDWFILRAAIARQITRDERSYLYWWALVTRGYTPQRARPER